MEYYKTKKEDVLKELHSSTEGLSSKNIKNDTTKNVLMLKKKESNMIKFLNEFKDIMIIILLLAALASFFISYINNESYTDSIIILAIVFLNSILGFLQELKADKALEHLEKMQISTVKVRRDNKIYEINSEDVKKGDILILEAGDKVPADARIIYAVSLKTDESSLTGESLPVEKNDMVIKKDVELADRKNMIYSGTSVVYGKCEAVVCKIGMDTEFGHIAKSLNNNIKELTPLQLKINSISKSLSLIILVIVLFMFILGKVQGLDTLEILMLSISLAVAAIPEGLPAVITIVLSLGMSSLANKKAIVRKMSSVETLGCTEIICSDKTGTITKNKMTVEEVFYNNKIYKDDLNKDNLLLKMMCLNNDANKNENGYVGDPTEIALMQYVDKYFDSYFYKQNIERIAEIPFDSERKMMSTVHEIDGKLYVFTKGSFDSIIEVCKYTYEDSKKHKLSIEKKNYLKKKEISESKKAYRIIAFAFKELKSKDEELEKDLIFIGMSSSIDPAREDVKKSIELCKLSNIKPIMITGDSLDTAVAIAKNIGILKNKDEAILGSELDKYNDNELKEVVKKYSVYARVSPTNKLSIVNAWKENGKVVAMTGDGVNDAPALKAASIGVGMGITGTEVSKSVSDIVLEDDSFSTIVTAVKEGRKIYDNIRKVILYLLGSNVAEVLIVFVSMIFGVEIFLPIQLLYINLITDSFPAISLAFEKEEENIMKRKIRKKDEPFFTPFLTAKMMFSALLQFAALLLVYLFGIFIYDEKVATTLTFFTLVLIELSFAFNCKNLKKSIANKKMFNNKYLNMSVILVLALQIVMFTTPLKNLFNLVSLNAIQVSFSCLTVILIFILDELFKEPIKKVFKDK